MIELFVTLKGLDERSVRTIRLDFNDGATLGDLEDEILSVLKIPTKYQDLSFLNVENEQALSGNLSSETLTSIGLKNGTKMIVNQEWWRRSLVMFHFLAAFLSLGDMHDGNFGREGDFETDQVPKPMIHDFMMSEYTDPGAKFLNASNFLRFINLETGFRKLLNDADSDYRLDVAREAVAEWDFFTHLSPTIDVLRDELRRIGRNDLEIKGNTDSLQNFVENVKNSVRSLLEHE